MPSPDAGSPVAVQRHGNGGSVVLSLSADLVGDLAVPTGAMSLVIFAHGTGSSRRSPRNQFVASQLQAAGFATLLFDLLSESEKALPHLGFDIQLLGNRLVEATEWAGMHRSTRGLRVAYYGASSGVATALVAAAARPELVRAVVGRSGRPGLASDALRRVVAPTRLIAGEKDQAVVSLNRTALKKIGTNMKDLVIVPGASHLFEEQGTLARSAALAADWFKRYADGNPSVALVDET
jgi:pimeloyl-ACP methyl ester carboxylesterase